MGQQHATPAGGGAKTPLPGSSDKRVFVTPSSSAVLSPPAIERQESTATEPGGPGSVPVMFKWTHGGQRVYLTGTFNNWASAGIPMVRSGQEFYQVVEVPRGVHEYKFLVDGEWKFSLDQPVLQDVSGNVNNVVDIQYYEQFQPAPLRDPLEVEEGETEWTQEIIEPTQTEPPSAPPLLMRLPLLGIPNQARADSVRLLSTASPSTTAAANPACVNIPLFSICGHVQHDASVSFRGVGSDVVLSSTSIRFAQKYSTTVLATLNNSTKPDGLLRLYGLGPNTTGSGLPPVHESPPVLSLPTLHRAPSVESLVTAPSDHLFFKSVMGTANTTEDTADFPNGASPDTGGNNGAGVIRRANSSGSDRVRSRHTFDFSNFTD